MDAGQREQTRVSRVDDLNPRIEALSACLFKILFRLEHDLVDAWGDLELRCLFPALRVAWGEERHAATVGVGDTRSRRSTMGRETEDELNC